MAKNKKSGVPTTRAKKNGGTPPPTAKSRGGGASTTAKRRSAATATATATPSSLSSSPLERLLSHALNVYTLGFAFFRVGELIPLLLGRNDGAECQLAFLGSFAVRRHLDRRGKKLLRFVTMLASIYLMDYKIPEPLPESDGRHRGRTVVVTGANSGVGYETSRQLAVDYEMEVVMGCRSAARCRNAAGRINAEIAASKSRGSVEPMPVDLSDFRSVESFASRLDGRSVDVLFNNAGYAPSANVPVNEYGLDPSFASMHLAHFLLAERLIRSNPQLRVVATSSGTHHLCAMPFTYTPRSVYEMMPSGVRKWLMPQNPGCLDEDYLKMGIRSATDGGAYIQAKIANVMHVMEIPKHHPEATAIAIDLGWVGTSIQPFMSRKLSPTSLGWMRNAAVGVSPMIHAILDGEEELHAQLGGERRRRKDSGFIVNTFGRAEEAFSYSWWRRGANADLSGERMRGLAEKLWEESARVLTTNGFTVEK
mmetsp:Transcript_10714/g.23243  ORF Transcript_10714/g.23243 Transcript_10714/m.23243 type:complete len:480 (-) Transcript_10714:185-1624(-)